MATAYFDCQSGISGDMVLGALVDAGVPLELLNEKISTLGIAGLHFEKTEVRRMGLRAVKIDVRHEPEHKHRHLRDIETLIRQAGLSLPEQDLAILIFQRLGEAEAKVHGCDIQKVHFHEVGAIDSIADIVGVSVGFEYLNLRQADFSPLPVGTGFVDIAHGRVGLPAPATAELLQGVPLAASDVPAELTTPTGAAIVRVLGSRFGGLPAMTITKIGCGAGTRDLPQQPNILRLLIGTPVPEALQDQIVVMETNIDDVSPELIGDCCERLRGAGALDVYTTSIAMKKNRPGVKLSVLTTEAAAQKMRRIIFAATRSLGIRFWKADRDKMPREALSVETRYGPIEGKLISGPDERRSFVPEYEACRLASEKQGVALIDVYEEAQRQFLNSR